MKHDERRREEIVDVYEAVTSRRAMRGFTSRPIPKEVLEQQREGSIINIGVSYGELDSSSEYV